MSCGLIALLLALPAYGAAQENVPTVPTNLQLYQSLATELADSLVAAVSIIDTSSVNIVVSPAEIRWFLEEAVGRPFSARQCTILASDSAKLRADFGALDLRVVYSNVRRSSLFGPRVVDRTVRLRAHLRLFEKRTGRLVVGRENSVERTDVLPLSMLEVVESSSIPVTRGTVPPEGFFSGWAEPLIVTGAVAVAIYLLFTVRS